MRHILLFIKNYGALMKHLIGILSLVYITLNLTFWLPPLLVIALLKLLIPIPLVKSLIYQLMLKMYGWAVWVNLFLFKMLLGIRFEISGFEALQKDENYLVMANHRSWADILILQSMLVEGAPIIKFIVKREILFLPLVGLVCWAYEYPLVRRKSMRSDNDTASKARSDLDTIRDGFSGNGQNTMSIVNFVEGTRFNLLKSRKTDSPHKHLLKPKAGGLSYILQSFGSQLDFLLDVTIVYGTEEPVFWNFLSGKCKRVVIEVRKIPIADLIEAIQGDSSPLDYQKVSVWLKNLWEEKDKKMDLVHSNLHHPSN